MNKKQSLFHIAKRDTLPWYKAVLIRGGAIVLALIVCAIVTTLLTGENPIKVYSTILYGAFGTSRKSWVTFHNLAILLGISLAVTPAFKMRFWNIGAEGQVLAGGLAAAACMICLGDKVPNGLLIVLIVLSGIAAGAVWAGIPAIFKAKWNTNETLFTLMMNTSPRSSCLFHHRLGSRRRAPARSASSTRAPRPAGCRRSAATSTC